MSNPLSRFSLGEFIAASDGGRVLELVSGNKHGIANLSIAWVEVDAGVRAQAHLHERTEEVYLIIEGSPVAVLDGQRYQLEPGDALSIPVGKVHWLENLTDARVRYVAISSPPYNAEDMLTVSWPD